MADLSYRYAYWWGGHDGYWIAYYLTAARLGVSYTPEQRERLGEHARLARAALWSWPHERGIVVMDRPQVLHMEEAQSGRWRLHADTGPAMAFRDGYSVYAWHGIRVPAQVIERPDTLTADQLVHEANEEVRRAMMERLGYDRVVHVLGATVAQQDDYGTLYHAVIGDEPIKIVRVMNGTPEPDGSYRQYWLPAPPDVTTARAFVGWSYPALSAAGLTPEDYTPTWRT